MSSGSLGRWLVIALKDVGLLVLALVEEVVLSSQCRAVELVADLLASFLQLQVQILAAVRAVGHDGSVVPDCEAGVARQCRDRVDFGGGEVLVQSLFFRVAKKGHLIQNEEVKLLPENVDHCHSTFSVGVTDSDANPSAAGDDLVCEIGF